MVHWFTLTEPGRIHTSKATAELLKSGGKEAWVEKRADAIHAKGKGILETYWINVSGERAGSVVSTTSWSGPKGKDITYGKAMEGLDERTRRLVNWNVETLLSLMKEIVARRTAHPTKAAKSQPRSSVLKLAATPLEEVREIIALPEFDFAASAVQQDPENVNIPQEVVTQLHHLVSRIASMYNDNPFHKYVQSRPIESQPVHINHFCCSHNTCPFGVHHVVVLIMHHMLSCQSLSSCPALKLLHTWKKMSLSICPRIYMTTLMELRRIR